jgi:hypothetical protein
MVYIFSYQNPRLGICIFGGPSNGKCCIFYGRLVHVFYGHLVMLWLVGIFSLLLEKSGNTGVTAASSCCNKSESD